MFFIWGVRWKAVLLGQLAYNCARCGRQTVHSAVVRKGKFTLFFVPLFPIGKKYLIQCNICGLQHKAISDLLAQLAALERTGQLPVGGSAPPVPVSGEMVCRQCRHVSTAGQKFCTACGAPVA